MQETVLVWVGFSAAPQIPEASPGVRGVYEGRETTNGYCDISSVFRLVYNNQRRDPYIFVLGLRDGRGLDIPNAHQMVPNS
jgi:hypothetical protein